MPRRAPGRKRLDEGCIGRSKECKQVKEDKTRKSRPNALSRAKKEQTKVIMSAE
jgi:hypothetical protein